MAGVTLRELAMICGVSEETAREWARDPTFPPSLGPAADARPFPNLPFANKREVAEIFGVSEQTISDWHGESPPFPILEQGGRGRDSVYFLPDNMDWKLARELRKRGMGVIPFEERVRDLSAAQKVVAVAYSKLLAENEQMKAELARQKATPAEPPAA